MQEVLLHNKVSDHAPYTSFSSYFEIFAIPLLYIKPNASSSAHASFIQAIFWQKSALILMKAMCTMVGSDANSQQQTVYAPFPTVLMLSWQIGRVLSACWH